MNAFGQNRFENLPPYKPSNQEAWYLPPDSQPLKLDWNESPVPPSPKVREAVMDFLRHPNAMNWYPDADSVQLRRALASHWRIPMECVQTYCGSDSALQSVVRVFTRYGEPVLMVSPTYDNFRIYALEAECRVILDGPQDIYELGFEELRRLLERHRPRLVYIANPNNPTGWLVSKEAVNKLAAALPQVLFLLDEAYGEFSGQTAVPVAANSSNVVVARTFSKAYGLAGLRIGYVVCSAGNVEMLNSIRNGKNVSMIGQIAAVAALQDQEHLGTTLASLRRGLDVLVAALNKAGIPHRSTPANFVLIQVKDSLRIQQELAKRRIYIRSMSHLKGMEGYLRITLGDESQMQRLSDNLQELL